MDPFSQVLSKVLSLSTYGISSKVRHLLACILGMLWCCRLRTWRRKEVVQIGFLLSRIFDSVCFIFFLLVDLMNESWVGPKYGKMYWLFLIIASSKSYSPSTVQDLSTFWTNVSNVAKLSEFTNWFTSKHPWKKLRFFPHLDRCLNAESLLTPVDKRTAESHINGK